MQMLKSTAIPDGTDTGCPDAPEGLLLAAFIGSPRPQHAGESTGPNRSLVGHHYIYQHVPDFPRGKGPREDKRES